MSNSIPVVTIGGNTELSAEILDLRIRHDLNTTSVCTMRAVDPDRKLVEAHLGKIGVKVSVAIRSVTCFEGIVIEVGTEQDLGAPAHLLIRCMDPSFLLAHQSYYRSFENQSYSKAVTKLAADAKLTAVAGMVDTIYKAALQAGS